MATRDSSPGTGAAPPRVPGGQWAQGWAELKQEVALPPRQPSSGNRSDPPWQGTDRHPSTVTGAAPGIPLPARGTVGRTNRSVPASSWPGGRRRVPPDAPRPHAHPVSPHPPRPPPGSKLSDAGSHVCTRAACGLCGRASGGAVSGEGPSLCPTPPKAAAALSQRLALSRPGAPSASASTAASHFCSDQHIL